MEINLNAFLHDLELARRINCGEIKLYGYSLGKKQEREQIMECPFCNNGLSEQNDCGESWDEVCKYCEGTGKIASQKKIKSLEAQVESMWNALNECNAVFDDLAKESDGVDAQFYREMERRTDAAMKYNKLKGE